MIGKLDQRITLQSYSLSADGAGGQTKTWANLPSTPTVWAHVKPGSGSERFKDDRTEATSLATFTIRQRSDVDELCRIQWGGVDYNIRQIRRASGREQYLEINAERGVSN